MSCNLPISTPFQNGSSDCSPVYRVIHRGTLRQPDSYFSLSSTKTWVTSKTFSLFLCYKIRPAIMEHQNEQSSSQPWALTDSLREALDTRVQSFLETIDSSKTMNAWGVTPRRDSIVSESAESSAAAEERAKTDPEATSTTDLTLDADHSLDTQIMLAESIIPKSAEKAEVEQKEQRKVTNLTSTSTTLE